MDHSSRVSSSFRIAIVLAALAFGAAAAHAQPGFSKIFLPDTIGPGSVSTLQFDITNNSGTPVTGMAFTDVLPASVTIASPAAVTSTCDEGTVSAPAGGTTITFTDGELGANSSCQITVNVTSSTPGVHMNVSGDLTSSAGNSGTASDDLTVDPTLPGFFKSFMPSSVPLGDRSTLTFTIDNSLNASNVPNLDFTDDLPPGMEIADPADASTDCGTATIPPTLTATPGTSVVILDANGTAGFPALAAGATCTVTVDVVATAVGVLENVSGELLAEFVSAGKAGAVLTSTAVEIALIKEFTDDPVPPGATVNLEFTILNRTRDETATGLTFSDDLDAVISGLAATGPPTPDPPCGAGSSLTGTSTITLNDGVLAPEDSCTFSVPVLVPAGAPLGSFTNTTSVLIGTPGELVIANQASDDLFVSTAPTLSKEFLVDPVATGGTTTLEFTIVNASATSAATDIEFIDELTTFLPFPVSVSLPPMPDPPCGAGSSLTLVSLGIDRQGLSLTDGNLAAGDSCTFTVDIDIPIAQPAGVYVNTTEPITGTVDGATRTGNSATDTLEVAAGPSLVKLFTDDPVQPGGTVTLEFTLTADDNAATDATGIAFTDDLTATLSGLSAIGLPQNDVCGTGSQISGTTSLSFTGGTLAPGDSCTFSVTLQVPVSASQGTVTNTTSTVTSTVSGLAVTGSAATDDLVVSNLLFTKEFIGDPVIPGESVILQFTLQNVGTVDVTGISFTDNVDATLSGLSSTSGVQNDICGPGSTIFGTTSLTFFGGSLTAGSSCVFSVTLDVPAGAADDDYLNTTSSLSTSLGTLPPATDVLTVDSNLLSLTKSFTDDPVGPGDTVTLEFTLTNLDPARSATAITYTDDLGAALSGLAAVGLPANDVCGAGSQVSGAGVVTLTGGNLPAGGSCTFSVTVQVPASVPPGAVVTNTTSQPTGTIAGLAVTGDAASDDLLINILELTKTFDSTAVPGGTVDLTFTIENLDGSSTVSGFGFVDDLGAVLSGLTATGLPASDVCGTGSQLSGASTLNLVGGELGPGGSCTFTVTLQVPASATPGSFLNTTSDIEESGLAVGGPATAPLTIEPPPVFSKSFAPDPIVAGDVSTLTFTIDNTASGLAATALDFTDDLPAGVTVASSPNASTDCSGGTLTAVAGSGTIGYTGGTVLAGASCTISVDVTSATAGSHVNTTGDLTSSSGNSGTASDTLTVTAAPVPTFAKSFAPNVMDAGDVSTLTFTIDNSASLVDATGLDFTDAFPAGLTVASPANATNDCGGTLTAVAGAGTISLTGGSVPAGASCTVTVNVTSSADDTYVNTTGDLTSSLGNSGTATGTLQVGPPPPPLLSMGFDPNPTFTGVPSTLTFTIDNTLSLLPATDLEFTATLPAGLVIASPSNASHATIPEPIVKSSHPCTGGTLTAVPGTDTIAYVGGTAEEGEACVVQVDVVADAPGSYTVTSSDLTSSAGNSGPASATLEVIAGIQGIPTLGEWALLLLASLLALLGIGRMRNAAPLSQRGEAG